MLVNQLLGADDHAALRASRLAGDHRSSVVQRLRQTASTRLGLAAVLLLLSFAMLRSAA
jgi:hypothetical protein